MIYLDTSALVRFFLNDDKVKAGIVEEIIKREDDICIPDVVFFELEHFLTRMEKLPKTTVVKMMSFLINRHNIIVSGLIKQAILLFRTQSISLVDCMLAVESVPHPLLTFDKKLSAIPGIKPYGPQN